MRRRTIYSFDKSMSDAVTSSIFVSPNELPDARGYPRQFQSCHVSSEAITSVPFLGVFVTF